VVRVLSNRFEVVWALGGATYVLGLLWRPHHCWIHDAGFLIISLNVATWMTRNLGPAVGRMPSILSRLQILCADVGMPFSAGNFRRKWTYPSILGAMALSIGLQIAAFIWSRAHVLLHLLSDGLSLVSILGFLAFILTLRRIIKALDQLEAGQYGAAPAPPKSAKFILLLLPKQNREHLIGDLEEEYSTVVLPEYGERKAQFWYWWQVLNSIAPILWSRIRRIISIALLFRRAR